MRQSPVTTLAQGAVEILGDFVLKRSLLSRLSLGDAATFLYSSTKRQLERAGSATTRICSTLASPTHLSVTTWSPMVWNFSATGAADASFVFKIDHPDATDTATIDAR